MNARKLHGRLLKALAERSRAGDVIDLLSLGAVSRNTPAAVLRTLLELERAGLVDSGRLRLTLQGLAVATALAARERSAARERPGGSSRAPGSARRAA